MFFRREQVQNRQADHLVPFFAVIAEEMQQGVVDIENPLVGMDADPLQGFVDQGAELGVGLLEVAEGFLQGEAESVEFADLAGSIGEVGCALADAIRIFDEAFECRTGEAMQGIGAENGSGQNIEQEWGEQRLIGALDIVDRLAGAVADQMKGAAGRRFSEPGTDQQPIIRQQMVFCLQLLQNVGCVAEPVAQRAAGGDDPVFEEQRQTVRVQRLGKAGQQIFAVVEDIASDQMAQHPAVEIVDHRHCDGRKQNGSTGCAGLAAAEKVPLAGRHPLAQGGRQDLVEIVERGAGIHPVGLVGPVDRQQFELRADRLPGGIGQNLESQPVVARPYGAAQCGVL